MNSTAITKVLIIEDNEPEYLLLSRYLADAKDLQFETTWINDPLEALNMVTENNFDVVLADYRLNCSEFDGLKLLAKISETTPAITILLTNYGRSELGEQALRQGIHDFLPKDELSPTLIERSIKHARERIEHALSTRNEEEKLTKILKLSAIGELATGIAHEINNPLAITIGKLEIAKRRLEKGDVETAVKDIEGALGAAVRITQIVRSLKALTRNSEKDERKLVAIKTIIEDAAKLCQHKIRKVDANLQIVYDNDSAEAFCHQHEISQVMINLIVNACDAIEGLENRSIQIQTTVDADMIKIAVRDSGPGIPPELRDKILTPYFTTKEQGKGTGLGLSISQTIASRHGGNLKLAPDLDHTEFVLTIPMSQVQASKNQKSILVVDDNSLILEILNEVLRNENLKVECCVTTQEAINQLQGAQYDIVLADLIMPDGSGEELYKWASSHLSREPDFVFMSGDKKRVRNLRSTLASAAIIEKPFEPTELLRVLQKRIS